MCNTHDIQVMCGPFCSNSYGLAKILFPFNFAFHTTLTKVVLSSYIVKHNGIDCGF